MLSLPPQSPPPSLTLPANTAYPDPNPDGATVADDGTIRDWKSPRTKIEWGGYFAKPGNLDIDAIVFLPPGTRVSYRLTTGSTGLKGDASGVSGPVSIHLGTISILHAGWRTFWLQGTRRSGQTFGRLWSLRLTGGPVEGAKFNLKDRRNAASVHLLYPLAKGADVEWFYNEITAKEDPLYTYYMACGFNRGYFGMQVNGPHVRQVIFSIWDSGKEAVDRSKVSKDDQVQLLAKGVGVVASAFGNEGTGGHSHLVTQWKTGVTQRFLVHAEPSGDKTTYTAYFWIREQEQWKMIARFTAPHDGAYLHGLYSFVEDFDGDNGNLKRKALFGPAWIKTRTGGWKPIGLAKFSHDQTGGKDRFDYDFGIEDGRFYLQNGGFEGRSPAYGAEATLPETPSEPPDIDLKRLESEADAAKG